MLKSLFFVALMFWFADRAHAQGAHAPGTFVSSALPSEVAVLEVISFVAPLPLHLWALTSEMQEGWFSTAHWATLEMIAGASLAAIHGGLAIHFFSSMQPDSDGNNARNDALFAMGFAQSALAALSLWYLAHGIISRLDQEKESGPGDNGPFALAPLLGDRVGIAAIGVW